ncbi:hypothetical protein DCAR_0519354 [Daucus carota subsp. sativus]|uniref:Uncharacterized protein n=1 Tax=Daucus carota subsp. sativus TaxID=79200 RepID=A0A164XX16_DAUCS|nr:hypothetical protein DCAR_0519354 [Daucus carota subsp. sativus]
MKQLPVAFKVLLFIEIFQPISQSYNAALRGKSFSIKSYAQFHLHSLNKILLDYLLTTPPDLVLYVNKPTKILQETRENDSVSPSFQNTSAENITEE